MRLYSSTSLHFRENVFFTSQHLFDCFSHLHRADSNFTFKTYDRIKRYDTLLQIIPKYMENKLKMLVGNAVTETEG